MAGVTRRDVAKAALAMAAVATMAAVAVPAWRGVGLAADGAARARRDAQVLSGTRDVGTAARDAERAQGGFVLTGRDEYLEAYRAAARRLEALRADLERLTAEDPPEAARVADLGAALGPRMDELALTARLRREEGAEAAAAAVSEGRGRRLMARVTEAADAIVAGGDAALQRRIGDSEDAARRSGALGALASGLTAALVAAGWTMERADARRVRAREALFRLVAERSAGVVSVVDADGRRTYVSPSAEGFFGTPHANLVRDGMVPVTHPDDRERARRVSDAILAGRIETATGEYRIVRPPEGRLVWVEGTAHVLRNPATGRTEGYVATATDVTARHEAQEEAARLGTELAGAARALEAARREAAGASAALGGSAASARRASEDLDRSVGRLLNGAAWGLQEAASEAPAPWAARAGRALGVVLEASDAVSAAAGAAASRRDGGARDAGAPLRLLLADDTAADAAVAVAILRGAGHRVSVEADAEGAAAAAMSGRYDAVLLGTAVPREGGARTAARIAAGPRPTPVVALGPGDGAWMAAGVARPYVAGDLLAAVREAAGEGAGREIPPRG